MKAIRRANERGHFNYGWLDTHHSFSFASYYDPEHMGVSVLRVLNDDRVKPGKGFGTHGHRDMEIITYVVKGVLEHKDSMGNIHVLPVGEVQRMSAGSGIYHSEYNASNNEDVHFFQIWIEPKLMGVKPGYEQKKVPENGQLTALVTPNGTQGSLSINQDITLYKLKLLADEQLELNIGNRVGYLHIISGNANVNNQELNAGDAIAITSQQKVLVEANEDLQAFWFDLPKSSTPTRTKFCGCPPI